MLDLYNKQDEEEQKKNPMHGATNFSKLIFQNYRNLKSNDSEIKYLKKTDSNTNEIPAEVFSNFFKEDENFFTSDRKRKRQDNNNSQREVFILFKYKFTFVVLD